MSKPLFTAAELSAHNKKLTEVRQSSAPWAECEAIREAHQIAEVRRAQARPNEFLDALILLIGSRGTEYVEFASAFSNSSDPEYRKRVTTFNTPETRRNVFTILKALSEVPKSWATSAFVRFLRGNGKQKGAKYHGAGCFGVLYGWKEDEVHSICVTLTGDRWTHNPYCRVLMRYADVQQEIDDADPDYGTVDYNARFTATRAERDVEFIKSLCDLLDSQGLADVPSPAEEKPKKERKVKQFHSGDIVSKSNLRDLPLPARIQLSIERLDEASGQWVASTIQKVVTRLDPGRYIAAIVHPNGKDAYYESDFEQKWGRDKRELEGATFLDTWPTAISDKKHMQVKFRFRVLRKEK